MVQISAALSGIKIFPLLRLEKHAWGSREIIRIYTSYNKSNHCTYAEQIGLYVWYYHLFQIFGYYDNAIL